MRRLAIIGVALLTTLAVTAVAIAQTPVDLKITKATMSPLASGTKKNPKHGTVEIEFTVNRESNVTADQITFNLPENLRLSGVGYKYCPVTKIAAEGASSCPAKSKIGTGSAVAYAGSTRIDYAITIYAASKNEIAMNLAGNVTVPPLRGIISDAGAPYGQKITVDIPKQVQQPIGGLYSAITYVNAKLGKDAGSATGSRKVTKRIRGKRRRVTVKTYFIGTTGCTGDKVHDLGVRLRFVPNPNQPPSEFAEAKATQACG